MFYDRENISNSVCRINSEMKTRISLMDRSINYAKPQGENVLKIKIQLDSTKIPEDSIRSMACESILVYNCIRQLSEINHETDTSL